MRKKPSISIIGPGRLGTALARAAAAAGWPVAAIGARDSARASLLADRLGGGVRTGTPAEAAAAGQMVFLTVSDEAIEPLCKELASRGAFAAGAIVAHCCGALDSEALAAARRQCGCRIASMHPLQTFPDADVAVERFKGICFFCDGDEPALETLERLAAALGGRCARIPSGDGRKTLYHAGATMACNHLAALIDAALTLMQQAGIERQTALAALAPLLRATMDNIATLGPEKALTGPVARGDAETVGRHLEGMSGQADLEAFYRDAARWTLRLARRAGALDDVAARRLEELLAGRRARP